MQNPRAHGPRRSCFGVLQFRSVSQLDIYNIDSEYTFKRSFGDAALVSYHEQGSFDLPDEIAAHQESSVSKSKHLPPEVPNSETMDLQKSGQYTQPLLRKEQVA